jgi:carboxyl-terminal processing protease
MKYCIFGFLLSIGLAVGVGAAIQAGEDPTAQNDPLSRLRDSYNFPFLGESYDFEKLELLKRVAEKISNDYVEPDRVDPPRMLDAALDNAARAVPEALFEYEPGGSSIEATVSATSQTIPVGPLGGVRDLTGVLEDVAAFLGENVPEDTELQEVEYALINGMLSTLDPHSVFIHPDAFEEMQIQNEGEFGGLGITIGNRWKDGKYRLTILYPLADTPAMRAGLKKQDRIVKIGHESTVNMSLEAAVNLLRGLPQTDITITVERDMEDDTVAVFDVTLTRELISIDSVKGRYLGDGVGGIQIVHFSEDTFDTMTLLITEMESQAIAEGREGLEGLVIDLRDNPGGYLSQSIYVSDKFIDEGVLVATRGRGRHRSEAHEATRYGTETDLRLVVLVDANSASASEIFAGAVRNLDRGLVMGVTTFGKGSVQNLYPFHHDGSALKLTIDHYLTPGNHSIQSVGIHPDIELRPVWVTDDDAYLYWWDAWVREKDLDDHFTGGEETTSTGYVCLHLDEDYILWDEDYTRDDPEQELELWASEFQVQFAKEVVATTTTPDRKRMLHEAWPVIERTMGEQDQLLTDHLANYDIDWSKGAAEGTPRAQFTMEISSDDGLLPVGERTALTLSVTNVGDGPFQRLRAMSEGDLLDGTEFLFGRIEPGETRSWSTSLRPSLGMSSRTGEVTFTFFADGSAAPGNFVGNLMVEEKPRPRFAYNYQVVDDGSGTSAGNGDGLVQAGEKIDLLVTVSNIGEGPTGDHYVTEDAVQGPARFGLDPAPDTPDPDESIQEPDDADIVEGDDDSADADDRANGPSGIVKISNRSGADLFLTEGTGHFSLAPGETERMTLHFDVAEGTTSELLELEMTVGDERFWEFSVDDVTLPLHPEPVEVANQGKSYRTKQPAAVLAGAHAGAQRVATVDGVVTTDGKAGDLVRVSLPWGGHGWVDSGDLKSAGNAASLGNSIEPWLSFSPPVIVLESRVGGTAVDSETVQITGTVRDNSSVRDFYVYVNGTKVYYQAVLGVGADETSATFDLPVTLEDGNNLIEIVARDDEDLRGFAVIGVYRTTEQNSSAMAE